MEEQIVDTIKPPTFKTAVTHELGQVLTSIPLESHFTLSVYILGGTLCFLPKKQALICPNIISWQYTASRWLTILSQE